MKKMMSLLLVLCLVVSMVPLAASATVQEAEDGALEVSDSNDLIEAFNGVSSGVKTIIRLKDNITVDESITIDEGQIIVLDLNGKKIESTVDGYTLVNNGILTINDEVGSGIICNISTGEANGMTHFILRNYGNLTINGGTFGDTDTDRENVNSMNWGAAIINMEGICTINGGYFTCGDNYWAGKPAQAAGGNANYSYAVRNFATMNMNGGTVYGKMNGGIAADGGLVTINGGTVSVTGNKSYACLAAFSGGGRFVITGGSFIKSGNNNAILNNFSGMPSWDASDDLLANGYEISGGTFTVNGKEVNMISTAVAQVGEKKYSTLARAVSEAGSDSIVKLVNDCTINTAVTIDKDITLDLNGYKITNEVTEDRPIQVTAAVNFTVDGTKDGSGMIIPESNTESYGFIKISAPATVTLNGGSYSGNTDSDAFVKMIKDEEDETIDASGATVVFNNVAMSSNGQFFNTDTLNTSADTTTLQVTGGTYTSEGKAFGTDILYASPVIFSGATVTAGTGPCIEVCGPNATFTDCIFTVTGTNDNVFGTTAVAVSWEGQATINSGTYSAPYGYGVYAYNSGGKIDVKGGTVSGGKAAIKADSDVQEPKNGSIITVTGGNINGPLNIESDPDSNASLTISGGYFTSDPSAYVAEGKMTVPSDLSGYSFMIGEKSSDIVEDVEPAAGDPDVDISSIPQGSKDEVETAAASVKDNGELSAAANSVLKTVTEKQKEDVLEQFESDIVSGSGSVNVYVQTYLNIKPTEYSTGGSTASLTMDITPMYRVVASTAETPEDIQLIDEPGNSVNAVVLTGSEKELKDIKTMSLSIDLPNEFVGNGETVYIQHKWYEYSATADNQGKITFTNPHGFSAFTFTTTSQAVAKINDTTYTSLQETVNQVENGQTIVLLKDGQSATVSREVTFTVSNANSNSYTAALTPGSGYIMTQGENGLYTFTRKPSTPVVPGDDDDDETEFPFTDVPSNAWYYNAVKYVFENDLMIGTSDTTFQPKMNLTRAMAAQILYNLEGNPAVTDEATFTDMNTVPNWAKNAIAWAQETGVVAGMGNGTFMPNKNVTREQFAQMMYNYAGFKGYDLTAVGDLTQFADADSISNWAVTALTWANGEGLINGHKDSGQIDPAGTTTRGQAATILMNYDLNLKS